VLLTQFLLDGPFLGAEEELEILRQSFNQLQITHAIHIPIIASADVPLVRRRGVGQYGLLTCWFQRLILET
jgi:hypothetical protein